MHLYCSLKVRSLKHSQEVLYLLYLIFMYYKHLSVINGNFVQQKERSSKKKRNINCSKPLYSYILFYLFIFKLNVASLPRFKNPCSWLYHILEYCLFNLPFEFGIELNIESYYRESAFTLIKNFKVNWTTNHFAQIILQL